MINREVVFLRIPEGFLVEERVNVRDFSSDLETTSRVTFEQGFSRMNELKAEGFREEKDTFDTSMGQRWIDGMRDYLFVLGRTTLSFTNNAQEFRVVK